MKKPKFVAHIGLHKTGTSYIQKAVLPELRKENNWIFIPNDDSDLSAFCTEPPSENVFLSKEGLSGACMPQKNIKSREAGVELLQAINANGYEVRVILFLRHLEDWMRSAFLQKRKKGVSYALWSLDKYAKTSLGGGSFKGHASLLDSISQFPILLIDYKYFLSNPNDVFEEIAIFSGIRTPDTMPSQKNKSSKKYNVSPTNMASIWILDAIEITARLANKLPFAANKIDIKRLRSRLLPTFEKLQIGPSAKTFLRNKDKKLLEFYEADWRAVWEKASVMDSVKTVK